VCRIFQSILFGLFLAFHQQAAIPTVIESTSFIMSRKRKQPDLDLEPVFNKFFAADASEDKDAPVKFLKAIKNSIGIRS